MGRWCNGASRCRSLRGTGAIALFCYTRARRRCANATRIRITNGRTYNFGRLGERRHRTPTALDRYGALPLRLYDPATPAFPPKRAVKSQHQSGEPIPIALPVKPPESAAPKRTVSSCRCSEFRVHVCRVSGTASRNACRRPPRTYSGLRERAVAIDSASAAHTREREASSH